MQIRQASPGDYRRLAELHVLARYDMAYLPHVRSFTSVGKWMRETVIPRQHVWVAVGKPADSSHFDPELTDRLKSLPCSVPLGPI